jgi:hypothetical protein
MLSSADRQDFAQGIDVPCTAWLLSRGPAGVGCHCRLSNKANWTSGSQRLWSRCASVHWLRYRALLSNSIALRVSLWDRRGVLTIQQAGRCLSVQDPTEVVLGVLWEGKADSMEGTAD